MKFRALSRQLTALVCALALGLTLSACGLLTEDPIQFRTGKSAEEQQAAFQALVDQLTLDTLQGDYLTTHIYLERPADYGVSLARTDRTLLSDLTEESFDSYLDTLEDREASLRELDRDLLTADQQELYDMLLFDLETQQALYSPELRWLGNNFDTYSGWHVSLPTLFGDYVFYSEEDVEAFLDLLADVEPSTQRLLEFSREQQRRGIFSADCAQVEEYCRNMVDQGTGSSVLADIKDNLADLGLDGETTARYQQEAEELFVSSFLAAYQAMADAMVELAQGAVHTGSLAQLEGGSEYYAALVRQYTGSSKTPEELQRELEDLAAEALTEMYTAIQADYDLAVAWENGEISSGYDDFAAMLADLEEFTFTTFPAVDLPEYTVGVIDPEIAADSVAAYFSIPPVDSTHPWNIMVNSADGSLDRSSLDTWCTVAHEGMPGHLYQTAYTYAALDGDLSRVVLLDFPGYTEGYATYAQLEALEYLDLDENVVALQRSYTVLVNSLVASADIGIHYLGWDMAELTEWCDEYGLLDPNALYDVLCESPATYLAYYAGYMEFHNLRQEAEGMLGDNFDVVEFHRALLDGGAVSFDVLEQRMAAWVVSAM